MEYCYNDWDRKCQCGGQEENCLKCGKRVSDCEFVSNWASCRDCFDKHYEAYLTDNPRVAQPAEAEDLKPSK